MPTFRLRHYRALALIVLAVGRLTADASAADIFLRFKVVDPPGEAFKVTVGGNIHVADWHLPRETVEVQRDQWSPWLDLRKWPLHPRKNRSGGVAEWPAIKLMLARPGKKPEPIQGCAIEAQLADQPDDEHVLVSFAERSESATVAFLVPHPLREKWEEFETGSQMAARHSAWAKEATGGRARKLKKFDLITALWGHYDPGLAAKETETLKLLGFNVLRGAPVSALQSAGMKTYVTVGHLDPDPERGLETWQKDGDAKIAKTLATADGRWTYENAAHCVIADEIKTMNLGRVDGPKLNGWFRQYLRDQGETDSSLGQPIDEVEFPVEQMFGGKTPPYGKRPPRDADLLTRKIFYHAGKFGHWWSVKQLRQTGDLVKQSLAGLPSPMKTETLPADHVFFAVGMGYRALDLFEIGARQAVDILSAEDWLGLNHMYGPGYTWTGAAAFGYYNGIMRSGIGDGNVALRALITPSDDGYLRLKAYSALGQGAKSFFFWTYGPTYIGTENYWSDLRSEYDGIARLTAALEQAEDILHAARPIRDRVAILYSVSHDLWHTDDPASAVEKRLTWTALRHSSIQPDILREEDVEGGRLADHKVLYISGQCLTRKAALRVDSWVKAGGVAYLTAGAATRDEFYESALPEFAATVWPADAAARLIKEPGHRYNERGDLPTIEPLARANVIQQGQSFSLPVIGMRQDLKEGIAPDKTWATFDDGKPAAASVGHAKGTVIGVGFLPGLAYSPFEVGQTTLDEQWPVGPRRAITAPLALLAESRTLELSEPVVEASLLSGELGSAIVLVNHTYKPIPKLRIRLGSIQPFGAAVSTEGVKVSVTRDATGVELELPLDSTDIILLPKP